MIFKDTCDADVEVVEVFWGEVTPEIIGLAIEDTQSCEGVAFANLTPETARAIAAELIRLADEIEENKKIIRRNQMSETPTPQAVFKGHAQKIVDGGFSYRQGGDGFTTPKQITDIKDLALSFQHLAQDIVNKCPEGAHVTGALRKLQQAQDAAARAIVGST